MGGREGMISQPFLITRPGSFPHWVLVSLRTRSRQVESSLRVLSAETTEEAKHSSVLVGGSQAQLPVSQTRAKLVEIVGRLTEPQSILP